ncbi:MAG TPA: hypothetical protein VGK73_13740 [Polyangiaceae bacterium]
MSGEPRATGGALARRVLYVVNSVLAAVFAIAFLVLALAPGLVERHARDALVDRIAAATFERYPELEAASWGTALFSGLRSEAKTLRELRDSPELEALSALVSSFCVYECKETKDVGAKLRGALSSYLRGIDGALQRVEDWARGRYHELVGELIRDLRIFAATNAVLCVLAAIAARRETGPERLRIGISSILAVSVLLGAWFYLFAQDWLQTLLFADYVGYAYLAWVAIFASVLADAVFNRGRTLEALLSSLAV